MVKSEKLVLRYITEIYFTKYTYFMIILTPVMLTFKVAIVDNA